MPQYHIAVIGGGPAGIMAAIRASSLGVRTVLLEECPRIGRKIILSGGGRCNLTNTLSPEEFLKGFKDSSRFLKTAFFKFSNRSLEDFFRSKGLALKTEGNKVFPLSNKAEDILNVLAEALKKQKVKVLCSFQASSIKTEKGAFEVISQDKQISASRLIIAVGGESCRLRDFVFGVSMVKKTGHDFKDFYPALVPLVCRQNWPKKIQGLSWKVKLQAFDSNAKKVYTEGEIIFTHFGISGPAALDLSNHIAPLASEVKPCNVFCDFFPLISRADFEAKFKSLLIKNGKSIIKNTLSVILPQNFCRILLEEVKIPKDKLSSQLGRRERTGIIDFLKKANLSVTGTLGFKKAMVSGGGVSLSDINPRTLESRKIKGLYFAGEIIEGCGQSGGFNIQQAFSTGYLAGESSASSLSKRPGGFLL